VRCAPQPPCIGGAHQCARRGFDPVAAWLARQTPGLRIVAQLPDDPQPLGISFNQDNPALLGAVNRAVAAMTADGAYAHLARKRGLD